MVLSTKQIIQAAKEHRVGLVLILSTAGVKCPEDAGSIGQSLVNLLTNGEHRRQMPFVSQ